MRTKPIKKTKKNEINHKKIIYWNKKKQEISFFIRRNHWPLARLMDDNASHYQRAHFLFFFFFFFFFLYDPFFCLFRLRRFFLLFINFCHFTNVMCRAAHHDLFLDRSWHLIGRFRRRPISERRLCATGTVRTARRPREAKLPFESSKNFLFFFFKAIKWSHVAVFF